MWSIRCFSPGGDIGRLAVCGTVNDLAVGGAVPFYLSCAIIIEEGVTIDLLRQITGSMAKTAGEAGVKIVTGNTKVVPKGACDKLFITTTGIGVIRAGVHLGAHHARPMTASASAPPARPPCRSTPARAATSRPTWWHAASPNCGRRPARC